MRATSAFVRLFIRGLAWDATDASATFAATLKLAARAKLTSGSTGRVLIGTGNGGVTTQFSLPPLGDLTNDDLAQICSLLLDKVDALVLETPAITDPNLVIALLAAFPSVRETRPDFTQLSRA